MQTHYDVLIVGAGLSGIGMACHLAQAHPGKRVAIIERRQAIGGTWDLFRYPGVRSDSDMFSFGYRLRPWHALKVLADGPSIRNYITDTAREFGVDRLIRFGLRTTRAEWSSERRQWRLTAIEEASGEPREFTCDFLVGCTGYYNYDRGHLPHFPGEEDFQGLRIHPQHWPEGLDYRGKRVVVIGSGATAVTLVPAMAADAAQVTMLQRSPSYVFSVPAYDKLSAVLQHVLPQRWVYALARKRNILIQRLLYKLARRWPDRMRGWLLSSVRKSLTDPAQLAHFTPRYAPWDERLCAVPDGDLFAAINSGKAEVVTDGIDRFTAQGIRLQSGRELAADIIVTATGLEVQTFGGTELVIDGRPQPMSQLLTYKGVMLQDVPNMAWIFGYTNAPWTLKADLAADYVCRLLAHMDRHGYAVVTARAPQSERLKETVMSELQSGYIRRARDILPRQGRHPPWRVLNAYERDRVILQQQPIADDALEFQRRDPAVVAAGAVPAA